MKKGSKRHFWRKKTTKLAVLFFLCALGAAIFASQVLNKPQADFYTSEPSETAQDNPEVIAPPIETDHDSAITVGSKAPDFTLPDAEGHKQSLAGLLKDGPVILSFYRGGWCPICNDQLYAYQQILPEFEELGAQLVAVSPERPESAQDTMTKNFITFTVLSDADNKVARQYDLIWTVPEDKREQFSEWMKKETGKTLAEWNGIDNYELPIPATFVIAQDGTVVYVFKDEDYKKRASNKDILKALENLNAHEPE